MATTGPRPPVELGAGGKKLWRDIVTAHPDVDAVQRVHLLEVCRMKDRLDKLDAVLRGDAETWMTLIPTDLDGQEFRIQVAGALSKANETANAMKQLIAAMRLPDSQTGKVPQRRGPRGAQAPSQPGGAPTGKVTSMDRARQRAEQRSTGS